jgi:hypothetical protein
MKPEFVEIAVFDTWADADIVRNRLIAKGIRASLSGPNTSATFGMYMGAASRVSVLVLKSSAAAAKRFLAEDAGHGPVRGHSTPPPTPIRKKAAAGKSHPTKNRNHR